MIFSNISKRQLSAQNYLPHNFLAEKMVLSCLLNNPELIGQTNQMVQTETFYFQNHQEIYKSIIYLYENNKSINIVNLTTFLQNNGSLKKVGGVKVLIELMNEMPSLEYLEEYLKLVKDKFFRRSLIKLGYEAINSGYTTNVSLEKTLISFETKLFNLTNEIYPQQISTSAELLSSIFFELKEKTLNPSLSGIASGFNGLDSLTQGFQSSDLIILAGRPSMGKTALSLSIMLNVIKNSKLPTIFFSLEMSKEQIMYRILAMETGINNLQLKSGKLSRQDWVTLNKTIKILSKLPFFIDDNSELSIQTIRSKLKRLIFEQTKVGLIIIDYLQLMQNSNSRIENRVQELSKITRSLKNLAREFNTPIIALSQLSRSIENRPDKKPLLSDLRESGSIEQDADVVLMIYNKLAQTQRNASSIKDTNIIIAKQRNGPTGEIQLIFDKRLTKFINKF